MYIEDDIMKSIINFYRELDTLNLILFWGIIIVIILLLIFSIIMLSKNKKLKKILISKNDNIKKEKIDEQNDDIPVKDNTPINVVLDETSPVVIPEEKIEMKLPEEKDFVAEEHVMAYKQELFSIPNIEKVNIEKETHDEPQKLPNAPYQRNVLREMSLSQTSPIGIVKRENKTEKNLDNAKELEQSLQEDNLYVNSKQIQNERNNNQKTYLDEVSQKLNEATNLNDIDRTAYEIEQEEEAIISYQELMDKKDHIKIVDEEDAVISIEELMNRKKQEEKIYNITKEEENNTFIDELKHFRHDL